MPDINRQPPATVQQPPGRALSVAVAGLLKGHEEPLVGGAVLAVTAYAAAMVVHR